MMMAVRRGLERVKITNEEAVVAVVDTIEIALDMEADEERDIPLAAPAAPRREQIENLPPPPPSVVREFIEPVKSAQVVAPVAPVVPDEPAAGRIALVSDVSDSDIKNEISRSGQDPVRRPTIRLQSLSGKSRQMSLQTGQTALESVMPEVIIAVADGREDPIKLFRSIRQMPSVGGDRRSDMLKLCYLGSGCPVEMETQELFTMDELQRGIEVDKVIATIKKKAFDIYRPRPRSIEATRPAVPVGRIDVMTEEGNQQEQGNLATKLRQKGAAEVQKNILGQ